MKILKRHWLIVILAMLAVAAIAAGFPIEGERQSTIFQRHGQGRPQ